MTNKKKEKIGLSLSGGGAWGYMHLALLEKIKKEDIEIDMIAGTSAGALIGAYYALYEETDSLIEKIKNMSRFDFWKLVDFNFNNGSAIKGRKVRKFLEKNFFGDKEFKDTKIKLVIIATDVEKEKAEYFTSGKILDAVMASLAFPGVFDFQPVNNRIYTDGGLTDFLPINILFKNKINKVIASDIFSKNFKINFGIKKKQANSLDYLNYFLNKDLDRNIIEEKNKKNIFYFNYSVKKDSISHKEYSNFGFKSLKEKKSFGEKEVKKEWKNFEKWLNN